MQLDPSRSRARTVFALTFGLMLSDYMSRQVVSAVFPHLKSAWSLSDTQLGSLVSVVALIVGVMTFPISLAADRWGRARAVTAMALVWCLATVACGLSGNFLQMFLARGLVGLGEAGYGSVGGALLMQAFPKHLRSTVMGAFNSAAVFGAVLGVLLGGVIAEHLGWRVAFIIVGAAGLAPAAFFSIMVRDRRPMSEIGSADGRLRIGPVLHELFTTPTAWFACLGSGLQLFILAALGAWIPSYLNRNYGLHADRAALGGSLILLVAGVGMAVGGPIADRLGGPNHIGRLRGPTLYAFGSGVLLIGAFLLPTGAAQLTLLPVGAFLAGGHIGVCGAVLTDVTRPAIHSSALAVFVLANNVLGLTPGPIVTGLLADFVGLGVALRIAPVVSLLAGVAFVLGARHYSIDLARREAPAAPSGSLAAGC